MADMGADPARNARRTWLIVLVAGALIGLALGVVVSITTDLPLAPEVGLVVGLVVAWILRRVTT
jgi:hypothetical protein